MGWKERTPLFFVPIRFWEEQEPETGRVARHNVCGKIIPDGEGDIRFVYVFHDGYGHTCYMQRDRCFTTREAAIEEALRLKKEKEEKDTAEFDAWWAAHRDKIFAAASAARKP